MQDEYEYARIGVDPVIFTIHDSKIKVLLHKREKEPYKDQLELPGGLIRGKDTAEETLERKLKETTGHSNIFFRQFYAFTKHDRDPRARTVTVAFLALISYEKLKSVDMLYDVSNLKALAFDHLEIIKVALDYLKQNLNSLVVKQLMPERFPINALQQVYEIIEGVKYDNRNFRKRVISSGIVIETEDLEDNVSHRPAKLYRFSAHE